MSYDIWIHYTNSLGSDLRRGTRLLTAIHFQWERPTFPTVLLNTYRAESPPSPDHQSWLSTLCTSVNSHTVQAGPVKNNDLFYTHLRLTQDRLDPGTVSSTLGKQTCALGQGNNGRVCSITLPLHSFWPSAAPTCGAVSLN
jgi:hypothetical protein